MTPAELYTAVEGVVKEQGEWNQTLIYETLGLRWGEETLVGGAAPVTVTLNQPYDSGIVDYLIWRQVYDTSGAQSEVIIVAGSQTETTFQVWAPNDCTFKYLTTYPTIDITP